MRVLLFILCCSPCAMGHAQITYKIEDDIKHADLRVRVGEDVPQPDLRVMIGENIKKPDLSIGITDSRDKASFIIVKADYADIIIRAGEDEGFPDITVLVGEDVKYADARVQVKTSGEVDYAVYSEKGSVSMAEMITVLLTVLNRHIKRPNETISRILGY